MIIVPGPASTDLGLKIGHLLKAKVIPVEYKRFPDGESYLRFTEELENENVVIVQTTGPPQDSNLIQLLLMIDAARDINAKSITTVVPYVAYARQDNRFRPGEAISSKTMFKLFESLRVDHFITVNFHSSDILNLLRIPHENLSAIPSLADYMLNKLNLIGAFSLAPDEGAKKIVEESSRILGGEYGWLKKRRDRVTGKISVDLVSVNVKGKDTIIFDDMISSGSTMISATNTLKALGARSIYVACVHPLLIGNSRERILMEGALKIVGTDCIQSPVSIVSIAPLIAEALRRRFRV